MVMVVEGRKNLGERSWGYLSLVVDSANPKREQLQ